MYLPVSICIYDMQSWETGGDWENIVDPVLVVRCPHRLSYIVLGLCIILRCLGAISMKFCSFIGANMHGMQVKFGFGAD